MSDYTIKQEGKLETLPSGAKRGPKKGKPRFDLIPTRALFRVANHYGTGGVIHGDRNWEQGIAFSELFASLLRHAYQFSMGEKDEDHLAAVVFNALAIMHFQETQRVDLNDMSAFKSLHTKRHGEKGDIVVTCPRCGSFFRAPPGFPRYNCFHCGNLFPPGKKNPEKPLTSEPPPTKIKAMSENATTKPRTKTIQWRCMECQTQWQSFRNGPGCDACLFRSKESHPREED